MKYHILTDIPFELSLDEVAKSLHLDEAFLPEIKPLFDTFLKTVRPKAKIGMATLTEKGDGYLVIDDVRIKSRVLRINLDKITVVYPFTVTSGREGYEMARKSGDALYEYWIDQMCELVLLEAGHYTHNHIINLYGTKEIYSLAPGSLPDWPMLGQRNLFALLGGEETIMNEIGLELTDTCLMLPIKSISGLYFESEEHFVQCSLCPRSECPNRREPFNEAMYIEKYGLTISDHLSGEDCNENVS